MRLVSLFVMAICAAAALPAAAQQKVKLTTLDWCPYTCATFPDGGFNAVVVRDAFKAAGYDAEFEFLPWQRAVAMASGSAEIAGYFPEYPAEIEGFALSRSIGQSPLGLITKAGVPAPAAAPEVLAKLRLGVVNGYVNAAPITAAIAAGAKPEGVVDDKTNIRKVAAGRIDAAEIDRYVLAYLLRNDKDLAALRDSVTYALTLEEKTLHVAFNNTEYGRKMAAIFAEGLAKIDIDGLQKRYFAAR